MKDHILTVQDLKVQQLGACFFSKYNEYTNKICQKCRRVCEGCIEDEELGLPSDFERQVAWREMMGWSEEWHQNKDNKIDNKGFDYYNFDKDEVEQVITQTNHSGNLPIGSANPRPAPMAPTYNQFLIHNNQVPVPDPQQPSSRSRSTYNQFLIHNNQVPVPDQPPVPVTTNLPVKVDLPVPVSSSGLRNIGQQLGQEVDTAEEYGQCREYNRQENSVILYEQKDNFSNFDPNFDPPTHKPLL